MLAFRLAGHHLDRRLPPVELTAAAGACGIQNTPPGAAALSLAARVAGLTPAAVERALEHDRTLLQVRSLRTAPHVFPAADLPIFTAALLPESEEELRAFILGAGPALDAVGLTATALADLVAEELLEALDGRALPFRALSTELTGRVAQRLSAAQLPAWNAPGAFAPGQSRGEALVHFALYAVALRGTVCFGPRQGAEAAFVRTDQWLGAPLPALDRAAARAELARRYLRCYGPSTLEHFGEWAGIAPSAAQRACDFVAAELMEVWLEGRPAWLRAADVAELERPPQAEGARLLPAHDPYLQQRDRALLVPDLAARRRLWRTVGSPGAVLVNGEIVALWRARKAGARLAVTVEPFEALDVQVREAIAGEAALLAPFRGCARAEIAFRG